MIMALMAIVLGSSPVHAGDWSTSPAYSRCAYDLAEGSTEDDRTCRGVDGTVVYFGGKFPGNPSIKVLSQNGSKASVTFYANESTAIQYSIPPRQAELLAEGKETELMAFREDSANPKSVYYLRMKPLWISGKIESLGKSKTPEQRAAEKRGFGRVVTSWGTEDSVSHVRAGVMACVHQRIKAMRTKIQKSGDCSDFQAFFALERLHCAQVKMEDPELGHQIEQAEKYELVNATQCGSRPPQPEQNLQPNGAGGGG